MQRGVKVNWVQPLSRTGFHSEFRRSLAARPGASAYLDAKTKLAAPIRSAPDELGEPPPGTKPDYPYERCNRWLLYTALAYGVDKVRFVCLWNGGEGDRSGGTAHMYNEVKRRTGQVTWIDIRQI